MRFFYSVYLKVLLCILLFISFSNRSSASHIVGADMFYTWVSGNTYKITVVLYGDCGPASSGAFASLPTGAPKICIYDGNTNITSINLAIQPPSAGLEITPVCPAEIYSTQCTNTSFALPGIKKFVYSANYTLPHTSAVWRFVFTGYYGGTYAGRAAAITNITAGTTMQLIDTLNNTFANNSSPIMTVIPTPFYCVNQSNTYNPGAIDGDGDNLLFTLTSGTGGSGTTSCVVGGNVTYIGTAWPGQPITASTPIQCAAGSFSMDALTGQLSFFPNVLQRALVVYNIREFRGGVLIGTCQREMTFYVRTCTDLAPSGIYNSATAGEITDSTHFQLCSGMGAFALHINPTDPDAGDNITVTAAGLPTGATFSVINNGTPAPNCTVAWNTTGVPPGSYFFFLTFTDDHCPETGSLTRAFTITINPQPLPVTGTFTVCVGATTSLANSTPGGTWSSGSPGVATAGVGTGVVTGVSPGTALISYNLPQGCVTTAMVTVNPLPTGAITGPATLCSGATITLTSSVAGGTWSTGSSTISISATGVVTGLSVGTGTVSYAMTTICGPITATRIITVNIPPVVAPITGPSILCEAATITLADATPGGVWSSSSANATVGTSGVVTGITAGTAMITYTVTNSCGSIDATKVVTVNPAPVAGTITGPATVCVSNTITLANAVTGGVWTSLSPGVATITGGGIVSGIATGTAIISYAVTNSCGTASTSAIVTVNPLPNAGIISGPSTVCVGAAITLTSSAIGGTWSTSSANATISSSGVVAGVSAGTAIISYTISNSCGTAYATKIITVNPIPFAGVLSGPGVVCAGSTISLSTTGTGGIWSSSATAVATVSATGVVTGIAAGTAMISYFVSNSCGDALATQVGTVNPLPAVAPILGPSSVCLGLAITLTNATAGGVWSSTGTATVSTTGVVTGVSGGTATISYSFTNSCGTAVATKLVTVNLFPDAGVISGPTILCTGATITLSETVASGTWATGSATASISATGVVTGLTAGTALISYTVVNGCGPATATYIVTVHPTPVVGPITGPTNVCEGSTITLSDTTAGGTWSISGTSAGISSTGVVTGITAGTAGVTYAVSNGVCSSQVTYTVTVDALPTAGVISGGPTVCTTQDILMTDPVPGGVWSCTANAAITTTGLLTGLTAGTATVSYTVTNTCGTALATKVITINLTPDAGVISGPLRLCAGTTITLSASATGGVWSSSTTGVATISSAGIVSGITTGTTTISYTVSTADCSARAIKIITVDPLAVPGTILGDSLICVNESTTLTSTQPGGTWSSSGTAGTISATGVVIPVGSGSIMVTYTMTNICGPVITTEPVNIVPLPDPGVITGPHSVCVGSTITLANAMTSWGTWSSSNTAVATINADGVIFTATAGTTTISYEVTNLGCNNYAGYTVTVAPLPEAGIVSGPAQACVNGVIQLSASTAGGTWSSSNPTIAPIDSVTGTVTVAATGSVTITYFVPPNSYGCVNKAIFPLALVLNAPFTIYENVTDVRCNGSADGKIAVTTLGATGPWLYQWNLGGTTASIENLAPGDYSIEVTDISSTCKAKESYKIKQPDAIEVKAAVTNDKCKMSNGAILLAATGGTAPYYYKWANGSTDDRMSALAPGVYNVTVSDNNQCEKPLSVDVLEGECGEIDVNTGITPNGDGANDYWTIGGLENYPDNEVMLFDKWGDKVFEQRGYDNRWDGRGRNGSQLPDGTYFYVIKLNAANGAGGNNVLTGSILIKR
ncbi:MAG: Ig-like domain-containing protein [Bacteroidota bacterium]